MIKLGIISAATYGATYRGEAVPRTPGSFHGTAFASTYNGFDAAKANPKLEVNALKDRKYLHIGLKNEPGFPTSDWRVHKAIYHAIDIDEIVNEVLFGH